MRPLAVDLHVLAQKLGASTKSRKISMHSGNRNALVADVEIPHFGDYPGMVHTVDHLSLPLSL